jgi:FAD synthase
MKFPGVDALRAQIQQDIVAARHILENTRGDRQ